MEQIEEWAKSPEIQSFAGVRKNSVQMEVSAKIRLIG
jgi:hypothetical protein